MIALGESNCEVQLLTNQSIVIGQDKCVKMPQCACANLGGTLGPFSVSFMTSRQVWG